MVVSKDREQLGFTFVMLMSIENLNLVISCCFWAKWGIHMYMVIFAVMQMSAYCTISIECFSLAL